MRRPNTLAFAVASGKLGYVYLTDGELRDWGATGISARSPEKAHAYVNKIMSVYCPELIVTERISLQLRKGRHTRKIMQVVEDAAAKSDVHWIDVERLQHHDNKYAEMDELAEKYPVLAPWKVAKRKPWQGEHRHTIIWEALALVDQANI